MLALNYFLLLFLQHACSCKKLTFCFAKQYYHVCVRVHLTVAKQCTITSTLTSLEHAMHLYCYCACLFNSVAKQGTTMLQNNTRQHLTKAKEFVYIVNCFLVSIISINS